MAAKKPGFPSKACPKCGDLIHARSLSHKKCGWEGAKSSPKASGKKTGKKRGRPAGSGRKAAADGVSISDIQAVKAVIDKLGAAKVKELVSVLG